MPTPDTTNCTKPAAGRGFGIGDCLGETKSDWYGVVDLVCPLLPDDRPRHLLGVGEPDDLVEGALRGIDTFDCAMPTRIARHGQALHLGLPRFRLNLTRVPEPERPPQEALEVDYDPWQRP